MELRRHQDWGTVAFDVQPVAPGTGPFPRRHFLETITQTVDADRGHHVLVESGEALIVICEQDGRLALAGNPDLTDYHSPLGHRASELVAALAADLEPGTELDFDSLPPEAARTVIGGLERAGLDPKAEVETVAAVLRLPASFDAYLESIGKKQRHEVRRKRRRYTEIVGPLVHETHEGPGWAFEEFVRLHRLAPGDKGEFMTAERQEFFERLASGPGWRIDVLRVPGTSQASATLFSFVDSEGIYIYNSSYDPDLGEASPGVAIIGSLIEQAIGEGLPRIDFLKGDEAYKFRLGAEERPLHRVRATR